MSKFSCEECGTSVLVPRQTGHAKWCPYYQPGDFQAPLSTNWNPPAPSEPRPRASTDEPPFPSDWKARRQACLQRDKYNCQVCGSKENLSAHHIIPRAEGGGHEVDNLITLCGSCHDLVEIADPPLRNRLAIQGFDSKASSIAPDAR